MEGGWRPPVSFPPPHPPLTAYSPSPPPPRHPEPRRALSSVRLDPGGRAPPSVPGVAPLSPSRPPPLSACPPSLSVSGPPSPLPAWFGWWGGPGEVGWGGPPRPPGGRNAGVPQPLTPHPCRRGARGRDCGAGGARSRDGVVLSLAARRGGYGGTAERRTACRRHSPAGVVGHGRTRPPPPAPDLCEVARPPGCGPVARWPPSLCRQCRVFADIPHPPPSPPVPAVWGAQRRARVESAVRRSRCGSGAPPACSTGSDEAGSSLGLLFL